MIMKDVFLVPGGKRHSKSIWGGKRKQLARVRGSAARTWHRSGLPRDKRMVHVGRQRVFPADSIDVEWSTARSESAFGVPVDVPRDPVKDATVA